MKQKKNPELESPDVSVAAGTYDKGKSGFVTPAAEQYTKYLTSYKPKMQAVADMTDAQVVAAVEAMKLSNHDMTHPVYLRYIYARLRAIEDRSKGRSKVCL